MVTETKYPWVIANIEIDKRDLEIAILVAAPLDFAFHLNCQEYF